MGEDTAAEERAALEGTAAAMETEDEELPAGTEVLEEEEGDTGAEEEAEEEKDMGTAAGFWNGGSSSNRFYG